MSNTGPGALSMFRKCLLVEWMNEWVSGNVGETASLTGERRRKFYETIRFALQVLGSLLLVPSVAMNKDNFIES